MTALALLDRLKAEGASLALRLGRLVARSPRPLPPGLVADLRAHKAELTVLLSDAADERTARADAAPPAPVADEPLPAPRRQARTRWAADSDAALCDALQRAALCRPPSWSDPSPPP